MSARSGTFSRISISGVSRLAAISGNAAFLAPPIGITPASGTPPLMQILSITSFHWPPALGRRALGRRGWFYWNRGEPLKPAARAPGPFLAIAEPPADPAHAFVPCDASGSRATLWRALLRGQPARYSSSRRSGEALSSCDATRALRRCQGVHLLLNAELPRSC